MIGTERDDLAGYLGRVRSRWQWNRVLRAWVQAALAAGVIVVLALTIHVLVRPGPFASAWLWSISALASLVCLAPLLTLLRGQPTDRQIARLVEERCPELDEALATAVALHHQPGARLAAVVVADALRRVNVLPLDRIVALSALRRISVAALAATLLLLVSWTIAVVPAIHGLRVAASYLMPAHRGPDVAPDSVKVQPGPSGAPPRVQRVDLHYEYPSALKMAPRDESNSGDIYGPVGTRVRVSVQADQAVASGELTFPEGMTIALITEGSRLEGDLTITTDSSYRIALQVSDGVKSPGDVEYFIRTLIDRPPNVRIVQPGADRRATPLEEVTIEARAEDDFGIGAFDLVYAVRGQTERVVPFDRGDAGLSVAGKLTIYLEDLGVEPGDFVTYYARASDEGRGKRATQARSDMFFLEIAPFDEEFVEAEASAGGGGGDPAVTDMIAAQKQIVSSTWTLDRRIRETGGRPEADIAALAKAQSDLRRRTLSAAAGAQRAADLRRRRNGVRPQAGPVPLEASDDAVGRAADAMLKAEQELQAFKTSPALPFEMTALNELMRADADVRRREIQRQQTAGTAGGENRQQQDLSSLFDKELARQQQTNSETSRPTTETKNGATSSTPALDKVRELAQRQERLNQQGTGRGGTDLERRQQLERLSRDQLDLKRQADDLARQIEPSTDTPGSVRGNPPPGGRSGQQDRRRALDQIAEQMQSAADGLRQQAADTVPPGQRGPVAPSEGPASANAARALEGLRSLEKEMAGGDEQRQSPQSEQESEAARRLSEEMSHVRDLRDRLEALNRELAERSRAGSQPEAGTPEPPRDTDDESGKDPWKDARKLLEDVRRERALGLSPEEGGFNPGTRVLSFCCRCTARSRRSFVSCSVRISR